MPALSSYTPENSHAVNQRQRLSLLLCSLFSRLAISIIITVSLWFTLFKFIG
nr:hypothetical protein [Moritella viscosa]